MFRGRVQGVYFRDTVLRIARRHAIGGFVRNLGRDRVELEAEGEPVVVDGFVAEVIANPPPAAVIDDVQMSNQPPAGETSFAVRSSVGR